LARTLFLDKRINKCIVMSQLIKEYEIARKKSIKFMKLGQINKYFNTLLEMNKCKRLLTKVVTN